MRHSPALTNRQMKTTISLLLAAFVSSACFARSHTPSPVKASNQIVVVTTADWNSPQGTLRRYQRAGAGKKWMPVGDPVSVMVGKNGLGWGSGVTPAAFDGRNSSDPLKREGDGKAPAGVFHLSKIFGYAAQPEKGWKMPYINLTSSVECVDDTASHFYNQVVDRSTVSPDWNSSEHMLRDDELYRWGILVDHNVGSVVPGSGSCIFMHIWRGPGEPTVGCTAMPQVEIEKVLGWLDPVSQPLLVQLPEAEYKKVRKHWHLPSFSGTNHGKGSTILNGQKSSGQ